MLVVPASNCRFGFGTLVVIQRENRTAILRTDIIALPVQLAGVMRAHEDVEQIGKTDGRRIEFDHHGFCMPGKSAANFLVGRIGSVAADVATLDAFHPDHIVHDRLGAPEAAARQDRFAIVAHRNLRIVGR